jgi:hypothetical protein
LPDDVLREIFCRTGMKSCSAMTKNTCSETWMLSQKCKYLINRYGSFENTLVQGLLLMKKDVSFNNDNKCCQLMKMIHDNDCINCMEEDDYMHSEYISDLIENKNNINTLYDIVSFSAKIGDFDLCESFVQCPRKNAEDWIHHTLLCACTNGHLDIVDMILQEYDDLVDEKQGKPSYALKFIATLEEEACAGYIELCHKLVPKTFRYKCRKQYAVPWVLNLAKIGLADFRRIRGLNQKEMYSGWFAEKIPNDNYEQYSDSDHTDSNFDPDDFNEDDFDEDDFDPLKNLPTSADMN